MRTWTDYPIAQLGDAAGVEAPVRECELIHYDGDKYARVRIGEVEQELKIGYVYTQPGRCGEVPSVGHDKACEIFGIEP